jgi:hypothetical protein
VRASEREGGRARERGRGREGGREREGELKQLVGEKVIEVARYR